MTKKEAKWWLAGSIVVLFIFYVLSPGPVLRMLDGGMRGGLIEKFFMILYWPLEKLYDNVQLVEVFYDWWFDVWGI